MQRDLAIEVHDAVKTFGIGSGPSTGWTSR